MATEGENHVSTSATTQIFDNRQYNLAIRRTSVLKWSVFLYQMLIQSDKAAFLFYFGWQRKKVEGDVVKQGSRQG